MNMFVDLSFCLMYAGVTSGSDGPSRT